MRSWGILGAGFVGGSMAADLLARGERVLAYDPSERAAEAIAASGAQPAQSIAQIAAECQLVICAVPEPRAGAAVLSALEASPDCLVIDAAAIKARVIARLEGSFYAQDLGRRFFPACPLIEGLRSGWRAARAGLFRDQLISFALKEEWDLDASALERVSGLLEILGARAVFATPEQSDAAAARYAQLPRLLAATQVEAILADPLEGMLSGSAYADLTAPAGRDPDGDVDALLANVEQLRAELERLRRTAERLEGFLARHDARGLRDALRRSEFARARLEALRWGERDPFELTCAATARELLEVRGPVRSLRREGDRLRLTVG